MPRKAVRVFFLFFFYSFNLSHDIKTLTKHSDFHPLWIQNHKNIYPFVIDDIIGPEKNKSFLHHFYHIYAYVAKAMVNFEV